MTITVTDDWTTAYPTSCLGILIIHQVRNPRHHARFEELKKRQIQELRGRLDNYTKADLAALPEMDAYRRYYKRFKKTYHVLLQLRSVVLQGKPLPSVAALVEASFLAELRNGLLTAAHDLDKVHEPVCLDIASGDEAYILLNGREQAAKKTDMIMKDAEGVICSVIYGLDRRTAVSGSTRRVMFVVYAPHGISPDAVFAHLEEIRGYVQVIAPDADVKELHVYGASSAKVERASADEA